MRLARALTVGGSASLVFVLFDGGELATGLDDAVFAVSVRRSGTDADSPELNRLAGVYDAACSELTIDLTPDQTNLLAPESSPGTIVGDVRVEVGTDDVRYFGPFRREIRGAGTLAAQADDANTAYMLTSVPSNIIGRNGDVALVRVSSLVVHAYEKTAGAWARQWAFSGGDTVLLASGAVVPDRDPADDPDGTRFDRWFGISGYAPVTDDDVDHANPSNGAVTTLAQLRGGNHGTTTFSRTNTLAWPTASFNWTVEVYVWFGIEKRNALGLSVSSVSQGGVDVPIVAQDDLTYLSADYLIYRSTGTYTQAEVQAAGYELVVEVAAGFPNTWNRYAVVTQNAVPVASDFADATAQTSPTIRVLIPNSGWGDDARGYLHFALPADQGAPTIAGQVGGINLIDDFVVRSRAQAVELDGDDMRTLSSDAPVFQMADQYSLFPWIIR